MIDPALFLPFANPAFAPDWLSRADPARPKWPPSGKERVAAFVAYCIHQLEELDRRAAAQLSPFADTLLAASEEENRDYRRHVARFLDEIGMDREEFEKLKRRERERLVTERERRGPTRADPIERGQSPSARAAEDMAKLRFVIYPRFWANVNLKEPSVHTIAARRWDCEPSAAESWYENKKVKKRWENGVAMTQLWAGGQDGWRA